MRTKHHKNKGSVIIIAVISLFFLSSLMYSLLRDISYIVSIARERQNSEQYYYVAYSLYCFIIIHHKELINNQLETTRVLFHGPWPDSNSPYVGIASIECKKNKRMLSVQLMRSNKELVRLFFPL